MATSSELSTAKRICPACVRSASRMAFSMASRLPGGNARRAAAGRTNRCRAMRARSMSPAPRCGAAAEAAAASAASAAAAASTAEAAGKAAGIAVTAAPAEQREQECNHSREERDRQRSDEQPRQRANHSARDGAAEKPAERRAQQASGHQCENQQDWQRLPDIAAFGGCRFFRRRQGLALYDAHHRVDAGADAAEEIAVAKARRDDVAHDALGGGVVERALQTVAHLDAQRPVVLRDDEQGAVVDLFAAQLPLLDDAQRVLLDRLGRSARHHEHGDLGALAQLELPELALQRRFLLGGQGPGLVHDLRRERRHGLLRPRRGGEKPRDEPDHLPLAPKSTRGGFAISCSFSTVKFGLGLKPKTIAVRLLGNERTVTLYSCTALM